MNVDTLAIESSGVTSPVVEGVDVADRSYDLAGLVGVAMLRKSRRSGPYISSGPTGDGVLRTSTFAEAVSRKPGAPFLRSIATGLETMSAPKSSPVVYTPRDSSCGCRTGEDKSGVAERKYDGAGDMYPSSWFTGFGTSSGSQAK